MWKFALILLYFGSCLSLYKDAELIIRVTSQNFEDYIELEKKPVVLHVYTPQSQECKDVSLQFKRVAMELKEIIKFACLQFDKEKDLAVELNIKKPNTLYVVKKGQLQQFSGPITSKYIVGLVMNQVLANLENVEVMGFHYFFKNVVQLDEDNFEGYVSKDEKPWMVLFYSPMLKESKLMIPIWYEAAQNLRHKVKFGAVDCLRNEQLAKDYDIAGYPTGVLLMDDATYYLHYNVHLTPDFIIEWIENKMKEYKEETSINELTSLHRFERCTEKILCITVFLPHIRNCHTKCRNNLLKLMTIVYEKYKNYDWGWLWSESGSQKELERSLGVENEVDLPKVVAINGKKKIFVKMSGVYEEQVIDDFLQDLLINKMTSEKFKKPIAIREIEMWNGKDLEEGMKNTLDYFDVDVKLKDEL